MKPINVLVVSSKYPPEHAGSGWRAQNTYKRLSEKFPLTFEVLTGSVTYNSSKTYNVDGHRVTRIAKKPFPSLATDERVNGKGERKRTNMSFIEKLKHGFNYFSEAILTWKYLVFNAKKFDIIHIFGKNWVTSATVTFAKMIRKPFIIEICNRTPTPHHSNIFGVIFGERFERFPKDTPIVCISDLLRQMCEEHGYKSNVWCRPNPVDGTKFSIDTQNKMTFRKRYTPFGPDDILLICISKFRPSKNQIFLLDVLKKLPEKFKLVLAGPVVESGPFFKRDQEYLGEIKHRINELHLEARVQLEPRFIDKVDEYLKMSDVSLFPTADEALGTFILEALSCGIPVVANRIKKVTDSWVEDGKNGYISDLNTEEFAEKVKKALQINPEVFRQKREEIISQCSADVIDEEYFDLIKKAVNRK